MSNFLILSKATGLFFMNPRAVLFSNLNALSLSLLKSFIIISCGCPSDIFSNLNAKQMTAFIPKKCVWKNIIESWCNLKKKHQINRTRAIKTYEEVMAQPVWINPEINITAFGASNSWKKIEKYQPIKRWKPLAVM